MQKYFVVLTDLLNLDRNLALYTYNTHLLNIQIIIYSHKELRTTFIVYYKEGLEFCYDM